MNDSLLNQVHCINCLELLGRLEDKSIDMIFCDPPYGHNNNGNEDLIHAWERAVGKQKHVEAPRAIANDGIEANDLFRAVLPEFNRVLKKGAVCCCCGGGGPDPQFARWSLWMDEHLEFKQMVVWDKGKMGMGWHYRRSYETVLVAQKAGAACFWFDDSNAVENIIRPDMNIPKIIPSANQHPTQKPEALAAHFIRLHTQKGMVVLDPFAGSGSTALAAKQLGRDFIAGEIDPQFVEMARGRLGEDIGYKSKVLSNGAVQPSLFASLGESD